MTQQRIQFSIFNIQLIRLCILHFAFCILLFQPASAQERLTLTDALAIALKNNYSILIARNAEDIAKNNHSIGNAGMLPSVVATASRTTTTNDTKQEYASGLEVDKSGVNSKNLNAGIGATWTLFDGLKMFATYSKLSELEQRQKLLTKVDIENLVEQIITGYFNIVQQAQLLKATQDNIDIYNERLRITQAKFEIGSSSKLEYLQAKVDLNEQRSIQMKQQTALSNAKVSFNQLLARALDIDFITSDTLLVTYQPRLEDLKTSVVKNNYLLQSAQRDVRIASLSIREYQSLRMPQLNLTGNYLFSRAENGAGFVLLNRNLGWNIGFTASWTLFDGFNVSRQINNAKLDYESASLQLKDLQTQTNASLLIAFRSFETSMQVLRLEEENLESAKENVTIAFERYRIGRSTQLELKEAQKSLQDAENRTISARYDAKVLETSLMKLNGELVK
jgi:outer membrane protein